MKSLLLPIIVIFLLAGHYLAEVSSQVILEVPGYGVLNGTNENSTYTERPFYAFRDVFLRRKTHAWESIFGQYSYKREVIVRETKYHFHT